VARDLRQISAALKMITDMERIGDQASDIAEIIISEKKAEAADIPVIVKMSEAAAKMVRDSVNAYVEKVSKLFDNINLREKMGKCSSKYVEEHCSYDVVSKEMEITVTNQRKEPIDMLSEKPVISNVK